MELTDTHNRRKNIETVSRQCKAHNYPYLAWPEDKQLLRIEDLPAFSAVDRYNKPVTWCSVEFNALVRSVTSDEDLRRAIVPGMAYAVLAGFHQLNGAQVLEYKIESRY